MTKFHSTVSRRDFMKGLGITGAGIGAASLVTPTFNDLDELTSSAPGPIHNYPWYVKERDTHDITAPHDWSKTTRTDQRHTLQCSWQGTPEIDAWLDDRDGVGKAAKQAADKKAYAEECLRNPRGWKGIRARSAAQLGYGSNLDTPNGFTTPVKLLSGAAKWEASPEENSQMIKAALRLYGAADVCFIELDDFTNKFVFTHDFHDGKPYVWEDVDDAYETGEKGTSKAPRAGKRVIPRKAKWLINYNLQMSNDSINLGMGDRRYGDGRQIQRKIQRMLGSLGYQACGPVDYTNNFSENVAFAVLGGMGELMRSYYSASPTFGSHIGVSAGIVTDLPLAPTKPIEAGMHKFCFDCMKCAQLCPGGAISRNGEGPDAPIVKEPSYETIGPWNRWPGRSAFDAKHPELGKVDDKNGYVGVDEPNMYAHWWFSPADCNRSVGIDICGSFGCGSRCVFGKASTASVHAIVQNAIAVTPMFNGFFRTMDEAFGYPMYDFGKDGPDVDRNMEDFFMNRTNMPTYGIDTMRGGFASR
jgi:reductive dehalogenase